MMESRALRQITLRPGAAPNGTSLQDISAWQNISAQGISSWLRAAARALGVMAIMGIAQAQPGWAQDASPPAAAPSAPAPGDVPKPAVPVVNDLPALAPPTANAGDVEDVMLPAKPAAVLAGESTWDDGFNNLSASFARINEALAKAGLSPAGRPIAVFLSADDTSFRYEAMVPLAATPPGEIAPGITAGLTPAGRALRFVHKAPYDEIDTTYEAITAYLDSKNMTAKDQFIEEYPSTMKDPSDPEFEINVYVQPK